LCLGGDWLLLQFLAFRTVFVDGPVTVCTLL